MNKGISILVLISVIGLAIAFFWSHIPIIGETVHFVLDPTAGKLLDWNTNIGMIIIAGILSCIITLLQKYTTDQKLLRSIRGEQALLREEMKKYKDHPEKMLELNKKSIEIALKTTDITLRPALYTMIPFILFFRWFSDYFTANPVNIFGMGWIWAYLILSILFSIVLRKLFKVA